jgi:di/tricarboxylate transporter
LPVANMTPQIALVLGVLGVTIVLFVTERLRVDVVAILVMLILAWLGLVTPAEAFSGLASNAVVSMIAVMILGYGIDRSGVMRRVTRPILRAAGSSERRLTGIVGAAVGLLSGFMQNIGAAALFLPAMLRLSKRTGLPASRLLMPMGFAAILGGTLTMVGSGPLIILNDLLRQAGEARYGLFGVTPIGAALLAAGIGYFVLLGRRVLPPGTTTEEGPTAQQAIVEAWQLPSTIWQFAVPPDSPLVGKTHEAAGLWTQYGVNLLALAEGEEVLYAPWRHERFAAGQELAVLGEEARVRRFADDVRLQLLDASGRLAALRRSECAGFAELIIPPRSPIAGKTLRQMAMRKTYSVEPLVLLSGAREQRGDFSDQELSTGDAIIVFGKWEHIRAMGDNRRFVLTTPVEAVAPGEARPVAAVVCFALALGLALSGVRLSVGLLTGAIGMVLLGVITMDEAYRAIDWRTVFLLAGLIPLGIATKHSGAAAYLAHQAMGLLSHAGPIGVLLAVALLSTLFSLFMSNVAATVLLVPLVVIMGHEVGVSPRALALLVAVCASNSFVLPTHQVNALLLSPGGYRNSDYLRAGGVMTLLFLVVVVTLFHLFYT